MSIVKEIFNTETKEEYDYYKYKVYLNVGRLVKIMDKQSLDGIFESIQKNLRKQYGINTSNDEDILLDNYEKGGVLYNLILEKSRKIDKMNLKDFDYLLKKFCICTGTVISDEVLKFIIEYLRHNRIYDVFDVNFDINPLSLCEILNKIDIGEHKYFMDDDLLHRLIKNTSNNSKIEWIYDQEDTIYRKENEEFLFVFNSIICSNEDDIIEVIKYMKEEGSCLIAINSEDFYNLKEFFIEEIENNFGINIKTIVIIPHNNQAERIRCSSISYTYLFELKLETIQKTLIAIQENTSTKLLDLLSIMSCTHIDNNISNVKYRYMPIEEFFSYKQVMEEIEAFKNSSNEGNIKFSDIICEINYYNENFKIGYEDKENCIYIPKRYSLYQKKGIKNSLVFQKFQTEIEDLLLEDIDYVEYFNKYFGHEDFYSYSGSQTPLINYTQNPEYSSIPYRKLYRSSFIQLVFNDKVVNVDYIRLFVNSKKGNHIIKSIYFKDEFGNLDIRKLNGTLLPIPILEEQEKIAALLLGVKETQDYVSTLNEEIITSNENNEEIDIKLSEFIDELLKSIRTRYINLTYIEKKDKVKETLLKYMKQESYDELLEFDKYSDNELKLSNKFTGDKLNEISKIGTIFECLETAEYIWDTFHNVLQDIEALDYTFLVANYFKAVELLLCKRIGISCKGAIIKYDYNNPIVVGDYKYYTITTLGNYNKFIKEEHFNNDRHLYDPLKLEKVKDRKVFSKHLWEWTKECRNAYQHKDNIRNRDKANLIRKKSYELLAEIHQMLRIK